MTTNHHWGFRFMNYQTNNDTWSHSSILSEQKRQKYVGILYETISFGIRESICWDLYNKCNKRVISNHKYILYIPRWLGNIIYLNVYLTWPKHEQIFKRVWSFYRCNKNWLCICVDPLLASTLIARNYCSFFYNCIFIYYFYYLYHLLFPPIIVWDTVLCTTIICYIAMPNYRYI